jgi:hypothetical protein
MLGASDLVMMRSPSLVYMSHPLSDLLLMLQPPRLQTVLMKFPFCVLNPVLLWLHVIVIMRFVFHALCFLIPPPLPIPLFALALPRSLVAVADAVWAWLISVCFFFSSLPMHPSTLSIRCNAKRTRTLSTMAGV